jgi:hypothetical protein
MHHQAVLRAASIAACLTIVLLPGASASDPAAGIPPDGPAGPVRSLADLNSWVSVGSSVTTQLVGVSSVSCPDCASATAAADFWVKDGGGSMRVHVQNTWQATYNVKKQVLVPAVGQQVVVQGRLQQDGSGRFIEAKRFGEHAHTGPTVHAYDVAAGAYATGTYAWLAPVRVLNVAHWDDGDYTWDVRDPAGGGLVHLELAPPFQGQLRIPNLGETVQPYGPIKYDPDHDWWEIHPVRCWSPGECVPDAADPVVNGPPSTANGYTQGGAVPIWVPLNSGGGGGGGGSSFTATFTIHSPNAWWEEATVDAPGHTVTAMSLRIAGGAWQAMSATSWGTWALSRNAPAGTTVEFLATDSGGATSQSQPFHWLDGTMSQPSMGSGSGGGSPPPPPSGGLTATFQPSPNSNEWWIQVTVTTDKPLATVEASVNGGPWTLLDHASWGDWVKSLHAPSGSSVAFRATATDGSSKQSPGVPWPPSAQPAAVDPPPLFVGFQPEATDPATGLVAVQVQPGRPLAAVAAQVGYGPWHPLVHQADGSWGAAIGPPDASRIVFRAVALDGQPAYSYPYSWPFTGD